MIRFWVRFAVRTLVRRRARSAITLAAIAVGVGTLIFLSAIMVGVTDAMIANSVALYTGHALVRAEDAVHLMTHWRHPSNVPSEVLAVLPRLVAPVLLVSAKGRASVQLVGVLPERERVAAAVPRRVEQGQYLSAQATRPEVVVGSGVAGSLRVVPGNPITIQLSDTGQLAAEVVGVFRTGIERFDEGVAYVHLDVMSALGASASRGEVALFLRSGISRRTRDELVGSALGPGETAASWEDLLPELEQLTRLNVVTMSIVAVLVVLVLAAGVSNTVLVSVMDRYREFGILKALGVTPGEVLTLIVIETVFLCLLASALGLGLGTLTARLFAQVGIDLQRFTSANPHFVLSSVIYPRLTWRTALASPLAVIGVGVLASLWPAVHAACRRPAEGMRLPA